MKQIKIGVGFGLFRLGLPDADTIVGVAEQSEEWGLDSFWLSDHVLAPSPELAARWLTLPVVPPPELPPPVVPPPVLPPPELPPHADRTSASDASARRVTERAARLEVPVPIGRAAVVVGIAVSGVCSLRDSACGARAR